MLSTRVGHVKGSLQNQGGRTALWAAGPEAGDSIRIAATRAFHRPREEKEERPQLCQKWTFHIPCPLRPPAGGLSYSS